MPAKRSTWRCGTAESAISTARAQQDVAATFQREIESGVKLAFRVRMAALLIIAIWTSLRIEPPTLYHYLLLICLLALVGFLQLPLSRIVGRAGRLLQGAVVSIEMGLLVYALIAPPPGAPPEWSMAMQFRIGNFDYIFVFIALTALTYHPTMALWTAFSAIVAWLAAAAFAVADGTTYTILDLQRFAEMDIQTLMATLLDPDYLSAIERFQEMLLAMVLASIVALACARARSLVQRESKISAERANLARYFSPDLVAGLASGGTMTQLDSRAEAGILFADLVGFTRYSEAQSPETVIRDLRAFHGRMAKAVFEHQGTLHKFLGDGLMASFGATTFTRSDESAKAPMSHALDCLVAILSAMAAWNAEREARGEPPMQLALGLHFGSVITGDVGDERCLEFAILGDAVNVASRLEGLCRPLDAAAVISQDAAVAAAGHPVLERFEPTAEPTALRGRDQPLPLLYLPREQRRGGEPATG